MRRHKCLELYCCNFLAILFFFSELLWLLFDKHIIWKSQNKINILLSYFLYTNIYIYISTSRTRDLTRLPLDMLATSACSPKTTHLVYSPLKRKCRAVCNLISKTIRELVFLFFVFIFFLNSMYPRPWCRLSKETDSSKTV